mgnify:CR=1 FL=1
MKLLASLTATQKSRKGERRRRIGGGGVSVGALCRWEQMPTTSGIHGANMINRVAEFHIQKHLISRSRSIDESPLQNISEAAKFTSVFETISHYGEPGY